MFKSRKDQDYPRGYIFDGVGSIENLLVYAIENHNLSENINNGRLVIKFKHNGDVFGLLVEMYTSEHPTLVCDIELITLDKEDVRHYTKLAMFHKETNFIVMTEYELRRSHYITNVNINTIHSNKKYLLYGSRNNIALVHYDVLKDKVNRAKQYMHSFESIMSIFLTNRLHNPEEYYKLVNTGAFWIKYMIGNKVDYYKISILKLDSNTHYIILLNLTNKSSYDYVKKDEDPYYDIKQNNIPEITDTVSNTILVDGIKRPKRKSLKIVSKKDK